MIEAIFCMSLFLVIIFSLGGDGSVANSIRLILSASSLGGLTVTKGIMHSSIIAPATMMTLFRFFFIAKSPH